MLVPLTLREKARCICGHARVSPQVSGCLTALVDSVLNPPRDDVLRTPTSR